MLTIIYDVMLLLSSSHDNKARAVFSQPKKITALFKRIERYPVWSLFALLLLVAQICMLTKYDVIKYIQIRVLVCNSSIYYFQYVVNSYVYLFKDNNRGYTIFMYFLIASCLS